MQYLTIFFRPRDLCLQPRFVRLLLGSEPLPPHSIIKPDEYTEINQDAKGW